MKSMISTKFIFILCAAVISVMGRPSPDISGCRVAITVREYGKVIKSNRDTVIALDKDTSMALAVNIANKGTANKFNVRLEAFGLDISDGAISRQIALDTGKTGTVKVAIHTKDVGPLCRNNMRGIQISVSPQNDPNISCGLVLKHFLCPNKKKLP